MTRAPGCPAGVAEKRRVAWVGSFQPILEEAWRRELAALQAADPLAEVWVLVPSRLLGAHLERLAAGAAGLVGVHFLTFTELAERLLDLTPRRLPPGGEVLVLRQALAAAVPPDGYFAGVREAPRFPAALAATWAELKTAGVAPADLAAAGAALGGATAARLAELAGILAHADRTLAAVGLAHPTDLLWAAARALPSRGGLPDALLAYGFTEWNAAERALLAPLAAWVPTTCFVPGGLEQGPGPPAELVRWLEAQGFVVERPRAHAPAGPRALARWLAGDRSGSRVAADAVEIVAAPGEEREIREIARRILAAAAEGVAFHEMGVLLPDPEPYRALVRDVFGAAGIPYRWGGAARLVETRAGRSLGLLLEARRQELDREAVFDVLATAPLRGIAPEEVAGWARLAREAGIVGGLEDWHRGLKRLARQLAPDGEAPRENAGGSPGARSGPGGRDGAAGLPPDPGGPAGAAGDAEGVRRFLRVARRLLEALAALPDRAPVATSVARLRRALLRLCRPEPELEAVLTALGGLDALAPLAAAVSLDELAHLVDAVLAAPARAGSLLPEGAVVVAPLRQALGVPFRRLFVPGLVERRLPAAPPADPLLLEPEREHLHAQSPGGRPGLRLARDHAAAERTAFSLALGAAAERVVLTYPRLDPQSGRLHVPSVYLLHVGEALTGTRVDFSTLPTVPVHRHVPLVPGARGELVPPVDAREWLLAQVARARRAGPAAHPACLAFLRHAARGRAALVARETRPDLTPWDAVLPPPAHARLAAIHRPLERPLAATALETYATCPFRYYLAHVLGIEAPRDPERSATIHPLDRGRLVHQALALTYRTLQAEGLLPLTAAGLPRARACLAEALARTETRVWTGLPALWQGQRARLLADLEAALAAEVAAGADWVPWEFEVFFGDEACPVSHPLPDGRRLAFHGRLDRLDLSSDRSRVRVVDYKTGVPPSGGGLFRGGTRLQLAVYRLAAEQRCRAQGLPIQAAEAEYRYLGTRAGAGRARLTDADWMARQGDFARVLLLILEGIAAGRFFPTPAPDTCRGCDFTLACGTERERRAWADRKATDRARLAHARLGEIE